MSALVTCESLIRGYLALVPARRVRTLSDASVRSDGDYVLYWMTATRRSAHSFALDAALAWAEQLRRPLLIVEPLQADHPHHSKRLEDFVKAGMRDNAAAFANAGVRYVPRPGLSRREAGELWRRAISRACVVIADDWPSYFLRDVHEAIGREKSVRVELIDSNGLVPLSVPGRTFARAHDFRRWWQKSFFNWWPAHPSAKPFEGSALPYLEALPPGIEASEDPLAGPISGHGGRTAGLERLCSFVGEGLPRYRERNHPDSEVQSRLSPYLHWGQISAHEVAKAVLEDADWDPAMVAEIHRGQREGWWGLPPDHEAFMDQLLTWRELGLNMCAHRPDYAEYGSLPAWAQRTLDEHRHDERPYLYSLEQFERAQTHDEIWNAAQRELVTTGYMHNYLRMLWGKKILHWSPSPEEALRTMITLNDRYALDGRDPNSYSGMLWVLGRYDRAWGPEREVFGKVRYMTSDSTRRKLKLKGYLQRFGPPTRGHGHATAQTELFA